MEVELKIGCFDYHTGSVNSLYLFTFIYFVLKKFGYFFTLHPCILFCRVKYRGEGTSTVSVHRILEFQFSNQ